MYASLSFCLRVSVRACVLVTSHSFIILSSGRNDGEGRNQKLQEVTLSADRRTNSNNALVN